MTDTSTGATPEMLRGELDPGEFRPKNTRTLIIGGVAIAIIVAAAILLPLFTISAKRAQFESELSQRLATFAVGRSEVISTWIGGVTRLGDRVTKSDFYRLFATEMDLSGGDISRLVQPKSPEQGKEGEEESFEPSLDAQIPLMTNVLTEYIQNTGFLAAHMLNREGVTYVSTDFNIVLDDQQIGLAKNVFTTGEPVFAPVKTAPQGFVMDVYLPIFPPQASGNENKVVGVLLLTSPVTEKVTEFVSRSPLAREGELTRLLQQEGEAFRELMPGQVPPMRKVMLPGGFEPAKGAGFAQRLSVDGAGEVYSTIVPVPGTSWFVAQEVDRDVALRGVKDFIRMTTIIAGLVIVAVIVAFGAFWWRLVGDHNKNLATQFRSLAARIESQKRLLDSINNTIQDYIGLKDKGGNYVYVNPAFARAVGRPVDKVIGLDDEALFGHGTAERLQVSDQQALSSGEAVTVDEEIYLSSRKHYLQISKVPLRGDDEVADGLVSLARDVTEVVEQRLKRENAVRQTVVALVRAIELRDPYLGGHSRRVAGFASAVAKQMALGPEDASTVEIAANLSQIGKLSIPRALLNKPERLTPEEMEVIQNHVEHAAAVLKDLDFGLPVFDAIYQMNERLDGSGYPKNLAGTDISIAARILAVCDVFCARIEPRSYRPAITAEETLDILKGNLTRYDGDVIAALAAVVHSPTGDKLMESI